MSRIDRLPFWQQGVQIRAGSAPESWSTWVCRAAMLARSFFSFWTPTKCLAAASTSVLARYASAAASDCTNKSRSPPAWLPLFSPGGVRSEEDFVVHEHDRRVLGKHRPRTTLGVGTVRSATGRPLPA